MAPGKAKPSKLYVDEVFGKEALQNFSSHYIRLAGSQWFVDIWDHPEVSEYGLVCTSFSHKIELVFSSPEQRRKAAENIHPDEQLCEPFNNPLAYVINANVKPKPDTAVKIPDAVYAAAGIAVGILGYLGVKRWQKKTK